MSFLKRIKRAFHDWFTDEAGLYKHPCEPSRPSFSPNPIRLMLRSTPKAMSVEQAEFLRTLFSKSIVKVGGFGGVLRADMKCVAYEDKPIDLYGTHRPYCVIREEPQRRIERSLNEIACEHILGKSYSELCQPGMGIGILAFEVDSVTDEVIEAWEIKALYWSRTDMDGRQDQRIIYLDLAGKVETGPDVLSAAKILHGWREVGKDLEGI